MYQPAGFRWGGYKILYVSGPAGLVAAGDVENINQQ